jgi:hypothetical protein
MPLEPLLVGFAGSLIKRINGMQGAICPVGRSTAAALMNSEYWNNAADLPDVSSGPLAAVGYFAWGCFRCFGSRRAVRASLYRASL